MVSYCWAQQDVVKRIHASLVKRGYRVWIDIEQMRGSTVESMAAAVETAEVMLIGVSREYKESTNCRLEAQYAMQREVPTVPLMLTEGYRADGWLGMLIGTRMWYGFYGSALSEESLFEGKMVELCRDLGDRGRSDADAARRVAPDSASGGCSDDGGRVGTDGEQPGTVTLRAELRELTVGKLRKRAVDGGVDSVAVEKALDSDDPKLALVELLVQYR
jgi:hypothetical protein